MKFTAQELGLMGRYLYVKEEGPNGLVQRHPDLVDLSTSINVSDKLQKCLDEKGEKYLESELELSTEEKALVLKYLADRTPAVIDGRTYLDIKTKLS